MGKLGIVAVAGVSLALFASGAQAAESASVAVTLQSQVGSTYNYSMSLDNTGTTTIGTFWYSWVPGQDYLDSVPSSISNPAGWAHITTGAGNSSDGTAIQWTTSSPIAAGQIVNGFNFSTTDTPAQLDGFSASHPSALVATSFVYSGAPEADPGFEFNVSQVSVPEPTSLGLLAVTSVFALRRRRRA